MAYSEKLAGRVRDVLGPRADVSERKMFGGLCILCSGNMACGIVDDTLMLRVGPDAYDGLLAKRHAREMTFTGRPMRGMLYVDPAGIRTARQLKTWVSRGMAFAESLPPK